MRGTKGADELFRLDENDVFGIGLKMLLLSFSKV
jgi:hypothetical protein